MDHWKKQNIDDYIKELKRYYVDPSSVYFDFDHLLNNINKEGLEYLNRNLDFQDFIDVDPKYFINYLLEKKEKKNFSFYVIRTLQIPFEVIHKLQSEQTVFVLLAEHYIRSQDHIPITLFTNLFQRGYKICQEDEFYVKELYSNLCHPEHFEKWCLLRYAVVLNDAEKFSLAVKYSRILFSFVSFKLKKPVVIKFPNLLGVAINAISHHKQCGDVIINAIAIFGCNEIIQKFDQKKGTFKRKVVEYYETKPIQNQELEKLIKEIFPELQAA